MAIYTILVALCLLPLPCVSVTVFHCLTSPLSVSLCFSLSFSSLHLSLYLSSLYLPLLFFSLSVPLLSFFYCFSSITLVAPLFLPASLPLSFSHSASHLPLSASPFLCYFSASSFSAPSSSLDFIYMSPFFHGFKLAVP